MKKNSGPVSTVKFTFALLDSIVRKRLALALGLRILLSFVDIFALLLVGLVGSIVLSVMGNSNLPNSVLTILEFLGINQTDPVKLILPVSAVVTLIIILKTFASIKIVKFQSQVLAFSESSVSSALIQRWVATPKYKTSHLSSQETVFAFGPATQWAVTDTLQAVFTLISEALILIAIAALLILVNPVGTLTAIGIFTVMGYSIQKFTGTKVLEAKRIESKSWISTNARIHEFIDLVRELVTFGEEYNWSNKVKVDRKQASDASGRANFLQGINRYLIEAGIFVGIMVATIPQFLFIEADMAAAQLALFLAVALRIMPSLVPIQSSLNVLKMVSGNTLPLQNLLDALEDDIAKSFVEENQTDRVAPVPVSISKIWANYEGSESVLRNVSLTIEPGTFTAIVGPSGSGKSTLIDVILGFMPVSKGTVHSFGLKPPVARHTSDYRVAYVPQEIGIVSGTLRENIVLGVSEVDDLQILSVLKSVDLHKWVESLPLGLDTQAGERGSQLSGGQKQRLGLARALISRPNLLVLDEATSALDPETEEIIHKALLGLKGSTTILAIAHRLRTVSEADNIIYLKNGAIIASGRFSDLLKSSKEFSQQVDLLSL